MCIIYKYMGISFLTFVGKILTALKKSTKAARVLKHDSVLTRKLSSGGFITYADRVAVSKILESNKYNILETANQLNIDESLVKSWHDQVKNDKYAEVETEKDVYAIAVRDKTNKAMEVKTSGFLKTAFDIKEAALKRMKDLVPSSESIRDLAMVIKTLHEIETGSRMTDDEEKDLNTQQKSFMMNVVVQQLKMVNNTGYGESESKRPSKGDSKG